MSYRKRFGRHTSRFQLNVSNLFDNDDLVVTSFNNNCREGGLSTNPRLNVPSGFRFIDPRRFTFTTAIEF